MARIHHVDRIQSSCRNRRAYRGAGAYPKARPTMGEPAKLQVKVRHYEVDEYGHVNHATYVHYLETARIEALEEIGLGLKEMRRQGYLIVAADLAVKYHAPAYSGETLEITTHVHDLRGARSTWI